MSGPQDPAQLPAYAHSLGIRLHDARGDADHGPVLTVDFGSPVEGRPGTYHGGATAGLVEAAGYAALRMALAAEDRTAQLKPITITMQYLSAGKSQPSFARGRITRLGRRTANCTIEAWQDDPARPIATAVMNVLIA